MIVLSRRSIIHARRSPAAAQLLFVVLYVACESKRFQIFDQRAFVGIGHLRPKVVPFVLDKIGAFICFDEIWNKIGENLLRGFAV